MAINAKEKSTKGAKNTKDRGTILNKMVSESVIEWHLSKDLNKLKEQAMQVSERKLSK